VSPTSGGSNDINLSQSTRRWTTRFSRRSRRVLICSPSARTLRQPPFSPGSGTRPRTAGADLACELPDLRTDRACVAHRPGVPRDPPFPPSAGGMWNDGDDAAPSTPGCDPQGEGDPRELPVPLVIPDAGTSSPIRQGDAPPHHELRAGDVHPMENARGTRNPGGGRGATCTLSGTPETSRRRCWLRA